jgi:hypothetical protein
MRHWYGLLAAALIGGCAATAHPLPAGAATADDSPPLIAGRLSAVEGDVRVWRAEENGNGAWDRAELNDVITVGTGLATDSGRAEVRVGPHAFRLGAGSTGGFNQLDFAGKSFGLERGVLSVRLAPAQQAETTTVVVAGVQIELAAPGRYRIDALDGAPLNFAVFEGRGTVRYAGNTVSVSPGQALAMTQSSMNFAAATPAALDAWALERDQRYAQWESSAFVSPYMTGYEDLGAYGDWVTDATYGTAWFPRAVPVGWAPYRFGRWRWVAPWGWTWVDAAPWGYAPFHYGRWVTVGGRWCWWPGGFVARPVWAPALVGFVGTGGTSVSVGFGGPVVGWYPLAPWNPYRPYYRSNTTYVTVINQTIIQRPPAGVRHDVNQRPGSTWVPQQRFHEPVAKVRIPAQTEKIADLQPVAPPPRPVRTAPADDVRSVTPATRVAPPHVRGAQGVAQSSPKFSVSPPQPLPGAEAPLTQPAPIRSAPPRTQPPPETRPEPDAPRPKPHQPQEIVPPYQQLQKPFPAEPARTPPAAPPTVRQPTGHAPAAPRGAPPQPEVAVPAPPRAAPQPKAPAAAALPEAAQPGKSSKQETQARGDAPAPRPDVPRPKTNVMER